MTRWGELRAVLPGGGTGRAWGDDGGGCRFALRSAARPGCRASRAPLGPDGRADRVSRREGHCCPSTRARTRRPGSVAAELGSGGAGGLAGPVGGELGADRGGDTPVRAGGRAARRG